MTELYKGNIRNHSVSEITITNNGVQIAKSGSIIIKKDALFYRNFSGKMISLDYDTVLPTFEEAFIYATNQLNNNKEVLQLASCVFVNDKELQYVKTISNKELKELKKSYKK
jgi:hypothetical protein